MRLTYTITADSQQAERANASVEAGLQRVEVQAKKTGQTSAAAHTASVDGAARVEGSAKAVGRAWSDQDKARESQWRAEDKRLRDQGKQTSDLSGQVQALGKVMLAAFAVDFSLGFVRGITQSAQAIRNNAQALGLSTRAFQTFQYAAEQGGGSVTDMTSALASMSKNLVSGPAGAVNALRALNLDIDQLRRLAPDQAFLAIADAIKASGDPMTQMQTALVLFGESGRKILPAIQQDFRATADEAAHLGMVIADDNVAALALFEDRWKRMQHAVQVVISNILGFVFQLKDAIGNAIPPWMQNMLSAGNPLMHLQQMVNPGSALGRAQDRAYNSLFYGGAENGPSVPTAPVGGGGLPVGGGFDTGQYSGLAIPEAQRIPATTAATRDLTRARLALEQATARATAADERYLRGLVTTVGVNRHLRDTTSVFAQTGIAGAMTGIDVNPNIPSTNPLMMTGLAPSLMGGSGYRGFPSAPATGAGFWGGRGGQAVGAGIGIAGGAAMGAMAGGDQMASLVGAGASAIGGVALSGTIASTAALGAATMGIGAAAVGVFMLAKHFTTVSKDVKQARVDIENFQQELHKTATATQMNEAAGRDWAATVIVVRDAYGRMGMSAAAAERDVAQLFDDSNPDRAREAMQRITGVMEDLQEALSDANAEMGSLLGQAAQLATRLPQSLLDQLTALVDRGDLTGANASLVGQLSGAAALDFDRFKSRADALGLDKNALGGAFAQHQTSKTAQQYIDDVDLFSRGGVDMGTILSGMSDELSAMVQEAMKFGTELPENMQPWIKELQRAGLLVDESGEKLEDISGLKWGEVMATSTDRLIDSIQELIDTLNGPLLNAFGNIPSEVRTRIVVDREDLPDPGGRDRPEGYQYGGVVYAAQGFMPRGTDTVPAMLTPGEGVLSRRGMAMLGRLNGGQNGSGADAQAIGRAMAQELARGGGLRPVVTLDGRILADELTPHLSDTLEYQGVTRPWR